MNFLIRRHADVDLDPWNAMTCLENFFIFICFDFIFHS